MKKSWQIRPLHVGDHTAVKEIFRNTIHAVNAQDYSPEQLVAWAPDNAEVEEWNKYFQEDIFFVADFYGTIVGFGSISRVGFIDKLYTHKSFQGMGIGSHLLDKLETAAKDLGLSKVTLNSTITAKGFYQAKGYSCTKIENRPFNGQLFQDHFMEKHL